MRVLPMCNGVGDVRLLGVASIAGYYDSGATGHPNYTTRLGPERSDGKVIHLTVPGSSATQAFVTTVPLGPLRASARRRR
jgi:hypothetical protein